SVTPEGGEAQVSQGQLVSAGLIPVWLLPVVIVAFALLCGLLYLLIAKPPVVQTFTYNPPSVVVGQPVTVSWRVNGAENVAIRPFLPSVDSEGSDPFDGLQPGTALPLVASNFFGETQQRLDIPVGEPIPTTPTPTTQPGAPNIELWSVEPTLITPGQNVT